MVSRLFDHLSTFLLTEFYKSFGRRTDWLAAWMTWYRASPVFCPMTSELFDVVECILQCVMEFGRTHELCSSSVCQFVDFSRWYEAYCHVIVIGGHQWHLCLYYIIMHLYVKVYLFLEEFDWAAAHKVKSLCTELFMLDRGPANTLSIRSKTSLDFDVPWYLNLFCIGLVMLLSLWLVTASSGSCFSLYGDCVCMKRSSVRVHDKFPVVP